MKRIKVETMIDTMLTEINISYNVSVKKSILHYVLKDEYEQKRIGIIQILNLRFEDYGYNIFDGIEPAESWKSFVK